MKKIFFVLALLLAFSECVFASETKSKDEKSQSIYYGGRKGDMSLSFSALPIVNFVGNMFNGTTSQSLDALSGITPNAFSGSALSVKYFVSSKTSMTFGAGFNCLKNKSISYTENNVTQDVIAISGTNEIMFLFGINHHMRPGKRLQPVLGANLLYAYANKNYQKKDDKSETNSDTNKRNPTNTFGIIGNLGVEAFLCQSVSLSAFMDLGLTTSKTRTKVDNWDEAYSRVNSSQTKFLTGQMGGNLAINFYF